MSARLLTLPTCSIYFYGGDSSITASTRTPLWLSDLAVLNMSTSFSLQQPNWSPVSGTQSILGGPSVYYHVGFTGTRNSRHMFIMGGITPSSQSQPDAQAYVYDTNRRLWTSFSLPNKDNLFRQGAAASVTSNGQAYVSNFYIILSTMLPKRMNINQTALW